MYAVFEDGSRQYRVAAGDIVTVDFREAEAGKSIEFPRVLLVADGASLSVGQPLLSGAKVVGEVIGHETIKTRIQKFRRRKGYKRLTGHTQPYTQIKVTAIQS